MNWKEKTILLALLLTAFVPLVLGNAVLWFEGAPNWGASAWIAVWCLAGYRRIYQYYEAKEFDDAFGDFNIEDLDSQLENIERLEARCKELEEETDDS